LRGLARSPAADRADPRAAARTSELVAAQDVLATTSVSGAQQPHGIAGSTREWASTLVPIPACKRRTARGLKGNIPFLSLIFLALGFLPRAFLCGW